MTKQTTRKSTEFNKVSKKLDSINTTEILKKPQRSKSVRPKLFKNKSSSYIKPKIIERSQGVASEVWKQLKDLNIVKKPIKKWTINQKETFIKIINKYVSISYVGDTNYGSLSDLLGRVNSYLFDGDDDDMKKWLDPPYIVVDWTNAMIASPLPDLTTVLPTLSSNDILLPSGQTHCYIVPSFDTGNFLLGILVQRWPGVRGFCFNSGLPIEIRG